MAEKPTEPNESHDVRTIHKLVRMMKRYDLTAIDFVEGNTKIRLRRRGPELVSAPTMAASAPVSIAAPAAAAVSAPSPASNEIVIESPMVGTFYASPSPDAAPFVTVGSNVGPNTTIGVFEAMKVFTEIPAGVSGTITEVLVKNGQPVEFGQPMFRVRPS